MSLPSSERHAPAKPAAESSELLVVRRRDVRRLPSLDLPGLGSLPRGYPRDPRYPSPRRLRQWLAFPIDMVVHLGAAFAVGTAAFAAGVSAGMTILVSCGAFVGFSFADRVFLQRACGATVGKLLTGLCVIRCDNGERPTVRLLIRQWFIGVFMIVASALG
ncbi:RDD family protein [Amycolatopsis sp. NPDC059657]|uniref:RDD family protein n=1 Tax=Amycolatopsis sp. NPDC059657 TaxID=3346899 RepID=UPI0036702C74